MSDQGPVLAQPPRDVQAGKPQTEVSLTRVGVRGVEKVIRVGGKLFFAEMECFVDLHPQQAGVHMSRFEEIVNEAIAGAVESQSMRAEELAAQVAEQVRERQAGLRAEVSIQAHYPETVTAPESGTPSQEIYKLHGTAVASERGTRTLTGVEAHGMTACPCAQEELAVRARKRLEADGFEPGEIERIFDAVPVATHNQRGIGELHLGRPEGVEVVIDAPDLLHIVEQSMSSEIYELMKRNDEASVVEKAHRNPRFVEDVVREMVRAVAEAYPGLRDGGFLLARQENLETIHRHTVVAERSGLISEVLDEIATGAHSRHHMTQREWLEAPVAP
ncbi:MAG: GTP cyclohydrolase MptA [Actinomycetota bacterium]|nr:GTP cyclohydrolase MptA [Actinomycetota bacterium]